MGGFARANRYGEGLKRPSPDPAFISPSPWNSWPRFWMAFTTKRYWSQFCLNDINKYRGERRQRTGGQRRGDCAERPPRLPGPAPTCSRSSGDDQSAGTAGVPSRCAAVFTRRRRHRVADAGRDIQETRPPLVSRLVYDLYVDRLEVNGWFIVQPITLICVERHRSWRHWIHSRLNDDLWRGW